MGNKGRNRLLVTVAVVAAIPIIGASVVVVGNNIGTPHERCDRLWMSVEASYECHQALYSTNITATQSQMDYNQRQIDETEANIRDTNEAIRTLHAQRPAK